MAFKRVLSRMCKLSVVSSYFCHREIMRERKRTSAKAFGSEDIIGESYVCPKSKQTFNTYEMLIRYVEYAKAAKLSIYSPNFDLMQRIWKTKKFKKQHFPGKTKLQSVYPHNLPGKTIPRSACHQGNKISKLEKSPEDGGPALRLEESFDIRELLNKDFRFTYFRRRLRN